MLAGLVTGIFHTAMGIPAILAGILTQLGLYSINLRIMLGKSNQAVSVDKYDLMVSLRYVKDVPFYKNTIFCGSYPYHHHYRCPVLVLWYRAGLFYPLHRFQPEHVQGTGINTNLGKIIGLMLSNGIVALASGLYAQYQGFADVNAGRGAIVIGLAAVIIGQVVFGRIRGNFAFKLLSVALGAIIYYLVLQIVLWLGLNSNDLKLLSALVVAVFLAIPYIKGKYFSKPIKKAGAKNA